jgi:lysophosphatidic acid acyltransferase/lysophosphatidylinositol acyltransferase
VTHLAWTFWCIFTFCGQIWSGSTVDVYGSLADYEMVTKEHFIGIMNHKYDVDWLMGWIVCQRMGILKGSKIIGKSSLRFMPLVGWTWLFTESIFIHRKWETDKKLLVESLDKILVDYPEGHFFNILMFCEGTRFTADKHAESMKVAREKNLPELKHHLLPRTKGFSLLAKGAAGRIGAIYDLTVGIEKKPNPDLNAVRNGVPLKASMFVRRIPFSDVPQDEKASAEWLHKFYQEKDRIFDVYDRTGSFESLGQPKINMPMNYYDLYNCLFWLFLLGLPTVYGIASFMLNASWLMNLTIVGALTLTYIISNAFIAVSQTHIGSKYGKNE